MTSVYLPGIAGAGDLVAELAQAASRTGANAGLWPGLTIYRFTAPAGPTWEEIQSLSLSLCVVAQGRKSVTVDGESYLYDPFHYLVLASHLHFQAEILEASVGLPFLSFVLQIDPSLVRQVSSDMLERRTTAFRPREAPDIPRARDDEAPLYLRELVYRVLQREQYARLLALAAAESASNPVSAVLEHLADNPDVGRLFDGYRMTSFTDEEEDQTEPGLLGLAWLLDVALKNAGAVFDDGPAAWVSHVVVDRNLITGQNPESTEATADAVIKKLLAPARGVAA